MERGKRGVNPAVVLKIGIAVAFSLGGMVYTFLRNKRIKPSKSPSDRLKSSDCNNQAWDSKSDDHAATNTTPDSCQFDPLATDKHDQLQNSNPDLSPNGRSNTDKDSYLLPEFNDLVKDFDTTAMKTNKELPISDAESPAKEIKNLRNTVKTLKERERNLEIQLLEYYGLKEQQAAVMELQNRLKLNNLEAKLFTLKIEALQNDNKRLQTQMADYTKVVTDLEAAKAKIKVLKKKLRSESAQNKEQILDLQERVEKMQEDERDSEIELKLCKLKDLEAEAEELRKSNYSLEVEKSELGQRLEDVQILATSVLEDDETEKLKEESERLKKENEDLTKEIERLQAERCGDVEELVYLRWINACLRYELRNHKAGPGKTTARDLSKNLSPESEQKAKKLIREYAGKEGMGERDINVQELDSDQWSSSQASNHTDSGDESFVSYPSPKKPNKKFFGKLVKMLRRKDSGSRGGNHHHRRHHHSRNPSLERREEDRNSYSDYSYGHFGNSSKHSMDSERLVYRRSDGGHKRINSIAESGGIGGGSNSPSSSDGQKSDLMKYAEVLKESPGKSSPKYRRRSSPFSSF